MKHLFLSFFTLAFMSGYNTVSAQSETEIALLLNEITLIENADSIPGIPQTIMMKEIGVGALPILATYFTDRTPTNVYSNIHHRKLTKGEIAMITADHIERIPYARLAHVQICDPSFLDSANPVENVFSWIEKRGEETFKLDYCEWLESEDRKEQIESYKRLPKDHPFFKTQK